MHVIGSLARSKNSQLELRMKGLRSIARSLRLLETFISASRLNFAAAHEFASLAVGLFSKLEGESYRLLS